MYSRLIAMYFLFLSITNSSLELMIQYGTVIGGILLQFIPRKHVQLYVQMSTLMLFQGFRVIRLYPPGTVNICTNC